MTLGHARAQRLFQELGNALGYRASLIWTPRLPTDGVWLTRTDNGGIGVVPVAALEVIVSEGAKSMRGSIAVLSNVSPALGVLLIQEDEIRRRLIRKGHPELRVEQSIERQTEWLGAEIQKAQQRLVIWTYAELARRHKMACRH